jgi:hypothetical protein
MNEYAFNIYYIVDSDTCQYKGNALLRSMATVVLRTVPSLHIKICLVLKSRVGQYATVMHSCVSLCHTIKQTNLI